MLKVLWSQARTQVLLGYGVLMLLSGVSTIFVIRQALYGRLQERLERSLQQEIQEFRRLAYSTDSTFTLPPDREAQTLFDIFLSRNVPGDDEYLMTFWQGAFYKASARALPSPLLPESGFAKHWAQLAVGEEGEFLTSMGPLIYRAEPVRVGQQIQGVLVVAQLKAGEMKEIEEVMWVVSLVTLGVLLVASLLGWVMVGRVLTPLGALSKATRSISAADLTQRIEVQGNGEVAELAQRFNAMMNRLEAAFVSQRQFMNDVGHELRTPLTIVRGHLELISDEPQERQETVALVLDEVDRMSHLVNDLLLLARAERPDFLRLSWVDLATLTAELYQKAQAIAPRQWRLEAIATGQVRCDRHRITEAVINLAQNAVQHTQASDVIALGSAMTAMGIQIWVRDTGTGIDPEAQTQIFERFGRAGSSQHRSEGLGLGLAIVEAIMQAHRGRVTLDSQPGTGSTFTLVFPISCMEAF